jgi:hypothetical protein
MAIIGIEEIDKSVISSASDSIAKCMLTVKIPQQQGIETLSLIPS